MQGQFENPKRICIAEFTVGSKRRKGGMVRAPGAHCELSDTAGCIKCSVWRLRRESLVDVVMSIQYNIHIIIVESLPDRLCIGICTPARTEEWNVPEGQRAKIRMRGQILQKPLSLWRTGATSTDVPTIRVQCNKMPGANVEAVVTLRGTASR